MARPEDDEAANRIFWTTHLQPALVWVLFPVTMPRELFYRPDAYNWGDAFRRWFDAPNNCLPSLHSANCPLFIQINWRRSARWLHTVAALAIVASTVLVKQHYLVDPAAGSAVFLAVRALMGRVAVEDREREMDRRASADAGIRPIRRELAQEDLDRKTGNAEDHRRFGAPVRQ